MAIRMATLGSVIVLLALGGCAASGGAATTADAAPSPCLKDTGSRLPASDENCIPGRSYPKRDIDVTGATTAAGALALMDPSITVGH